MQDILCLLLYLEPPNYYDKAFSNGFPIDWTDFIQGQVPTFARYSLIPC